MNDSIVPNILFDDLYDLKKYESLVQHCFFVNILDNSNDDKDLDEKFSDRYQLKKSIETDFMHNPMPEDKLQEINRHSELFTNNFQNGFLKHAIENIPEYYNYCLNKFIREKGIYSKLAKVDFYENENERLLSCIDELQDASHLTDETIKLAVNEVYNCIDFLNNLKVRNEAKYDTIPFDLKKVELILLFAELQRAGYISGLTPSELFTRMEKYFTYDGNIPIQNIYKEYQEYKSGRKNSDAAINGLVEKLSKTFPM